MKTKKIIANIILMIVIIAQFNFITLINTVNAVTNTEENNDYHYKYFYSQLSDEAKKIYDAMCEMYEKGQLKTGNTNYDLVANNKVTTKQIEQYKKGNNNLIIAFENARDAFYLDYPEVFYINMEKYSIRITSDSNGYHVWLGTGNNDSYYLKGFSSVENVDNAIAQYNTELNTIVDGAKELSSQYIGRDLIEKQIEYIHNEVIKSATYKLDDVCKAENRGHIRTPYGALVAKEAVCEGYAKSVKVALDKLGIPCILVRGVYKPEGTTNGENHMWNYVQINEKWYAVDATFDDYEGKFAYNDYLLAGYSTMQKEHNTMGVMSAPEFEFTYPDLEYENYGVEQAYDYNGLIVNYGMTIGETLDGDEFKGGKFYINYKKMGMETAKNNGYYFLVRYGNTGDWYYMESLKPEYGIYGKGIMEDSEKELIFYNSNVKELEFAVTTCKYKEPITGYETINNKVITNQVYQASLDNIIAKTDIIDNVYEWKPSPNMIAAYPYIGTKLKPGQKTRIKVTYNDKLVASEDGEQPSVYVESNAWTTSAEINSKIENFGHDDYSIWFDFTPSSMWGDNSVIYTFKIKGLVGNWSKLTPRAPYYYVQESFGCSYSMMQANKWRIYGRPTLIDTGDVDFTGWELEDGVVTSEEAKVLNQVKEKMALVVTPTNKIQENEIKELVSNTEKNPQVLGMECYNINLVVCNKNVLKSANGDKITVYLGFPEGYGPESEGVTFKTYHIKNVNGQNVVEEIECVVTPYGLLVSCDSFSPYAVAAVKSTEEDLANTSKSIAINSGENGIIEGLENAFVILNEGETKTYTIKANEGYQIDSLTIFGKEITDAIGKSTYDVNISYENIVTENNIVNVTYVAKTVVQEEVKRGEIVVAPLVEEVNEVTGEFEISLESVKSKVAPGEVFEVNAYLKNLKNIKDGIVAFIGQLELDTSVVEIYKANEKDDILIGNDGWNLDAFNDTNFKFIADNDKYITQNSHIFTIKFKVNENITTAQDIKIALKNVSASGGNGVILPVGNAEETIHIEIKKEEEKKEPDTINSSKYDVDDEGKIISDIIPNTTVAEFVKNITSTKTPVFTDSEGKTLTDKDKVTTGTTIKIGNDLEYTLVVIGDIDEDGDTTVNDLAKLKLHLIDLQKITGIYQKAADIDETGDISINDLAQLKLILIGKVVLN